MPTLLDARADAQQAVTQAGLRLQDRLDCLQHATESAHYTRSLLLQLIQEARAALDVTCHVLLALNEEDADNTELWESRQLGADEAHARPVSAEDEQEMADAMKMP